MMTGPHRGGPGTKVPNPAAAGLGARRGPGFTVEGSTYPCTPSRGSVELAVVQFRAKPRRRRFQSIEKLARTSKASGPGAGSRGGRGRLRRRGRGGRGG